MENITLQALATKYLAWCEKHRSPRTCEWYNGHLLSFLDYPGIPDIEAMSLKPYHVSEWIDSKDGWGDTYKRGAIVAVQRMYNWAEEMGHVSGNPVRKLKKPSAKRREIYMKPEDYEAILALLSNTDPFRDLFRFVWFSGCRPQEVRHIEPRHVDLANERIVFPAEESKGKRAKRIIYLQGVALEIVQRLILKANGQDKLFLNYRMTPWTKFAICNRFHRISKRLGRKMFCYAARHGFGTRKLIQGHDHLTVAALMGHTDGSMLARIYSHISDDRAHLNKALQD